MNATAKYPTVSIIMPLRNEEKHIEGCIRTVLNTDYPKEKIEIVIADGMSTDRTTDIIESLKSEFPFIKVFLNPRKTPYSGLNICIEHASGDVILRVDARSICPANYISLCVDTLLETGADNVGGTQHPIGSTTLQRAVAVATTHPFGVGNAQFRIGEKSGYVDTVYLGCFRREVFDKLGHYDESGPVISEDSEMNQRIRNAGGKVYLNKDIVVQYVAKDTIAGIWNQYLIYGGAKAHSFLKSRKLTSWRQFIPLAFLPAILASIALIPISPVPLIILLGIYLGVSALVSLSLVISRNKINIFPLLIIIFFCIHFAWPSGFYWRVLEGSKPGSHWRK